MSLAATPAWVLRDNEVLALSDAQKSFLLDPRPYVKGGCYHPAVRTMHALEKRGFISVEEWSFCGQMSYETKLTEKGAAAVRRLKE